MEMTAKRREGVMWKAAIRITTREVNWRELRTPTTSFILNWAS